VQVCTAVMHYGYRVVEDMIDGLCGWMDQKGYRTLDDFRGLTLPRMKEWKHLDLNYKIVARIDAAKCIGCDLCYVACWDGAHQCIHHEGSREAPAARTARTRASVTVTPIAKLDSGNGHRDGPKVPVVDEEECVGCNLCSLVCPVDSCITMVEVDTGRPKESWEQRTAGRVYAKPGQE